MMTIEKSMKRHAEAWSKVIGQPIELIKDNNCTSALSKDFLLNMWLESHSPGPGRTGVRLKFRAINTATKTKSEEDYELPMPPGITVAADVIVDIKKSLRNARRSWTRK